MKAMEQINTVVEMLIDMRKQESNPKLLNWIEDGIWKSLSTTEVLLEIRYIALGLVTIGIKRGENIGILAPPSPKWLIVDLAIMVAGAVSVPIFSNISEENFHYQTEQAELKTLFVENPEILARFDDQKVDSNRLIYMEAVNQNGNITYDELRDRGKRLDEQQPQLYESLEAKIKPDDLATIIYTSGSTGIPKGAEITQSALVFHFHLNVFDWDRDHDKYLNVLPLAHIFGNSFNLFFLKWGISIYYCNDTKNFIAQCQEIKPTILILVPRIIEKIYSGIHTKTDHTTELRRMVRNWCFKIANQEPQGMFDKLKHYIADKLVFSTLRNAVGGAIRLIICGGASLDPKLARFFHGVGLPICEGYGLTEGVSLCFDSFKDSKIGSVGKPAPGVEVKLSHEGEILVRSKLMMRGYYKNPQQTQKAMTHDGYFHTGDKGYIDADKFVFILGRMTEMYKTSTGEWIVPLPIEQALCHHPLIDMALVIGEDKNFASCLLFPDFDVLHQLKCMQQAENLSDTEFLQSAYVKEETANYIAEINKHLNHAEQLRAFRYISTPLSVEKGDLTPSLKIRRGILIKKFDDIIQQIYAGT